MFELTGKTALVTGASGGIGKAIATRLHQQGAHVILHGTREEKLINLDNDNFCYLTKIELEILICLIRKKEISKNFIKENILNIRSNIETNSLESHLSRIRKKMSLIKTKVKIQTKNEKLLITT